MLVGALVSVCGLVLSVLLRSRSDLSSAVTVFAMIGLFILIVGLPIGAALAPGSLLGRRRMLWAGMLFALVMGVGPLLPLAVIAFGNLNDPAYMASQLAIPLPYFLSLGIAAAAAWIMLMRRFTAGILRRSIPVFIIALALIALVELVISVVATGPSVPVVL
jgi:hypothetical protein